MKPTDFSLLISDFLNKYLPNERDYSYNTFCSYRDTFVLLISYIEEYKGVKIERITLDKITRSTIVEFLDWLQSERNCCNATLNVRLSAIHSFYKYVQYVSIEHLDKCHEILSIRAKKAAPKAVTYLTIEGIELLLKQPDVTSAKGVRDLALLSLMYDTGCRVQELIDLTPSNLRLNKNPTILIKGKGNKTRLIPMLNSQVKILKSYIELEKLNNPAVGEHPLFFNSRKEKLSRTGVTYVIKKYFKLALGENESILPKKMSCHSLRHSKAMHLLQAGVQLVYIRDILGHVSIRTTELYARADSKQKRKALEEVHRDLTPDEDGAWENNFNLKTWLKSR